jgi:tRNA modification GTPase
VVAGGSDTIAAIATASGPAGVGIVRVSGPDAIAIAAG